MRRGRVTRAPLSGPGRVVLALAALTCAALFVAAAVDVGRWRDRLRVDDLRYQTDPTARGLWRPSELTPFHPARTLLGIDDDVAYRKAVRLFRLGRTRERIVSDPELSIVRGRAQEDLTAIADSNASLARRSDVENLLGILALVFANDAPVNATTFIDNASASFRQAATLNTRNDVAKFNLEFAYTLLDQQYRPQQRGHDQPGQVQGHGGLGSAGSGY